jgi:hypothetical protein
MLKLGRGLFASSLCWANSLSLLKLVKARPSGNRMFATPDGMSWCVKTSLYIGFTFGSLLLFSNYSLADIILDETTFRLSRHLYIWRYISAGVKQTAIKNCTIVVQGLATSSCCKVSFEGCVFEINTVCYFPNPSRVHFEYLTRCN